MGKKIFIFLILFLFIPFFFTKSIFAEDGTTEDAIKNVIVPGVTCGDYTLADQGANKCCIDPQDQNYDAMFDKTMKNFKFGCLIDVAGIKGFCISTLMVYPAKKVIELGSYVGLGFKDRIMKSNKNYQLKQCVNGEPSGSGEGCTCVESNTNSQILCDMYLKNSSEYGQCVSCSSAGVWTGIGCVYTDLSAFISNNIFGMGLGLAGIFLFFRIIYSVILIQLSEGNPEKLKKAKENITSSLIGLLVIIFSIFILRIIGVNVLKIPGFK